MEGKEKGQFSLSSGPGRPPPPPKIPLDGIAAAENPFDRLPGGGPEIP